MPRRFWIGLAGLTIGELLLRLGVEPAGVFRTPIMWTAFIFFADGLAHRLQGHSPLSRGPSHVAAAAVASIAIWVVFEGYNLHLDGWRYEGLPDHRLVRTFGYAWSFATIGPAMFITSELVRIVFARGRGRPERVLNRRTSRENRVVLPRRLMWMSVILGVISCAAPLAFPAERAAYLWAPVWAGFIFLVDPINAARGRASIWIDAAMGDNRRLCSLLVGGALCGLLWEFWNYEAIGRWVYTFPFPISRDIAFGEMPVIGFLGFPPFAVEYFVLTEFVAGLWGGNADFGWHPSTANS